MFRSMIAVFFTLVLSGLAFTLFLNSDSAKTRRPRAPKTSEAEALWNDLDAFSNGRRGTTTGFGILSGQHVGHATDHDLSQKVERYWNALQRHHRALPTVMAVDYCFNELPDHFYEVNQILARHASRGGVISIGMHPPNPWTNGPSDDLARGDFEDLFRTGSEAHQRWMRAVDRIAMGLRELERARVPVLFRPLHQMNGEQFWWSVRGGESPLTTEQFVRLWRHLHDALHGEHQLQNLLWVYSPKCRVQPSDADVDACYPGDLFTDLVSLDFCGHDLGDLNQNESYQKLQSFERPMALSEFTSIPADGGLDADVWLSQLQQQCPQLAYFVFGSLADDQAVGIIDQRRPGQIMQADGVWNLDRFVGRQPSE